MQPPEPPPSAVPPDGSTPRRPDLPTAPIGQGPTGVIGPGPTRPPRGRTALFVGIAVTIAALAVLAIVVAARDRTNEVAGGGEANVFEHDGLRFEYPAEWRSYGPATFAAEAGTRLWGDSVGPPQSQSEPTDLVILTTYRLNFPVTDENLEGARAEFEAVLRNLSEQGGETWNGRLESTEVAGLPALEARDLTQTLPNGDVGTTRIVVVFDGSTEYAFNCQSRAAREAEILAGCDQALSTLTIE